MKKIIYLLFISISFLACNDEEKITPAEKDVTSEIMASEAKNDSSFDPQKWQIKEGSNYPYREQMLSNLMNNKEIRALKEEEIIELLGKPDRLDSNYLFYRINEKRLGWLTLHTKTMVVKMHPDSSVNWIKIHE